MVAANVRYTSFVLNIKNKFSYAQLVVQGTTTQSVVSPRGGGGGAY